MRTKDLTAGERLLIARRRLGESQDEAGARLGVSRYRYRKWESDEYTDPGPPRANIGALKPFESCLIRRRRAGVSLAELAEAVGVTRWWLCQMEGGDAPADRLVAFWSDPSPAILARENATD